MKDSDAIARGAVIGAVAGTVATLAMSVLMVLGQRAGLLGKMPPRRVSEKAQEVAGISLPDPLTDALAAILHVALGAGAGAGYGATRAVTKSPLPGAAEGAVFGLAFWAANYIGVAPALGILPPPDRDKPGRPPVMIAAHLVFGSVLGTIVDALEPRRR